MNNKEKHIFSFYYPEFSSVRGNIVHITDATFVHRVVTIMRYRVGDVFILFDRASHAQVTIDAISKKDIRVAFDDKKINAELKPELILFLPLLKKEALEQSVYNAVVAGITGIQLIVTEKCHRKTITIADWQRLEKIIIAACEQSKYYRVPLLHDIVSLSEACHRYKEHKKYYADFEGKDLAPLTDKSIIMVGPEGDLTEEEKKYMQQQGAYFFLLTPTVLRSQEAVLVAIAHARMI